MPQLLPEIVYLAVSPYGGHEEALAAVPTGGRREQRLPNGDATSLRTCVSWRLPRGRHGLPRELVERSQRERLLAAVVHVTVAKGYEATTVADILGEAGVGRESFYELFDDKLDCMLAAHKILVDDLETRVRAAYVRRDRGRADARGAGDDARTGSPPTLPPPASSSSSSAPWARPSARSSRPSTPASPKLLDEGSEDGGPYPGADPGDRSWRSGRSWRGSTRRSSSAARPSSHACSPTSPTTCSSPSSAKRWRGPSRKGGQACIKVTCMERTRPLASLSPPKRSSSIAPP